MIKGIPLGKSGNKVSLLLGLTLGAIAAVLVVVYLQGAKTESGGSVSGPSVPVVVAAQDIGTGTRVTAEMLTTRNVPEDLAFPTGFRTPEEVVGQITTVPITAGEQVIGSKVTSTGEDAIGEYGENPPLTVLVPEGMRGVSVEVNSIVGAGGLIRPGDRVDVILTVKTDGSDDGKNQIAATVVQDLEVVAIDQDVAAPSTGDTPEENNPEAVTATLLASPSQVEVLVLADGCRLNFEGRLGLAVRSFGDQGRFTTRQEWPADGRAPDCASLFGLTELP